VVTVAFNPGEELERFLASLAAATARRLVVVIADNGTEHDVVTAAAQRHGARVVGDGTNLGYGAGANLAAADLEEDWIVVANPDLVWKPGSLDALIDAGLANPAAGCLGPLLLNPDGTVYPSGRALPSLVKGAGHAVLGRIWPANPFSAAYHTAGQGGCDGTRTVGWLSGACLLLPAAGWRRPCTFDADFFRDLATATRVDLVRQGKQMSLPMPGNLDLLNMLKSSPRFVMIMMPNTIDSVMPNSVAAKAGLRAGDKIGRKI